MPGDPHAVRRRSLRVLVAVLLVGYAIVLAVLDEGWELLTFQTTQVDATVIGSEQIGWCSDRGGTGQELIRYELRWTEDGRSRLGRFEICGHPQHAVGDTIDVHVTARGVVAGAASAWLMHALVLGSAALLAWVARFRRR